MFLRPDFECLQELANLILDRLIRRALGAKRTALQGPLFRAQSRKSVVSDPAKPPLFQGSRDTTQKIEAQLEKKY